jgi:uncharacterized protein YndB with AHSA1/START domain
MNTTQQPPVVKEVTVNAPANRVWKALTDSNLMKQWYFDIPGFKPEVGFEFQFTGGEPGGKQYVHLCRVMEAVPNKKLKHSWRYEGYEGDSFVTWELFEDGNKTRVKLTHEGLETFPPVKELARENFIAGWNGFVNQLLPDIVEVGTTAGTAQINAPADKVWEVLTDLEKIKEWAAAFHEGTTAETTWKEGDSIIWMDGDGNVGASGIVLTYDKPVKLEMRYYDDVDAVPSTPLGDYHERFTLKEQGGKTTLEFTGGTLPMKYVKTQNPMWKDAMERIRTIAER